jgi:phosphoribosylamine--glycine ligase
MGAYAPVSLTTPALMDRVVDEVLNPTLEAMAAEGSPFRGLLYAGLMVSDGAPRVVEFNCRFGDPETQVVLPLMDGSLLEPALEVARGGSLAGWTPSFSSRAALTTVLASEGYPGSYPKGREIHIPEALGADSDTLVFHAGTAMQDGRLVTSGGRVLAVTALGETLAEAAKRSRAGAESITFEGRQLRRDIGWRELERQGGGA